MRGWLAANITFALYDQDWGAGCSKMRVSEVQSQGRPADHRVYVRTVHIYCR